MTSIKDMRRDLKKMQVGHLMEHEWIKKVASYQSYNAKINLADRILAKQSFGRIDDAEIIKKFKDRIRSQKKVVQEQKKAFQKRKQSKLDEETAMYQARQNAAKLMSQTSSKIVKAPVVTVSPGESKESVPVAQVLRGPTKIPKTKKKKSTGCFGSFCKKDDAEGGGKRKTRRNRKHKKRKTKKGKRKRKRKTRRRKKRTKRKTRKQRR